MDHETFWHRSTFADIQRKTHFHYKKETEEFRTSWEQTRLTIYYQLLSQSAKNSKLQLTDIMEFPWDEEDKEKRIEKAKREANMTSNDVERILSRHNLK